MVTYVCYKCGSKVEFEKLERRMRCPYCGGKIFFKERPHIVRKLKAR